MAHPVAEMFAEPRILDRLAARGGDLAGKCPGGGGRAAPPLRPGPPPLDTHRVRRRLAAIDRSTKVGAVAVHDAAKVEHDRGSLREGAARRGGAGIEVIVTE